MKRILCILIALLLILPLAGCGDSLRTTSEYKTLSSFADRHSPGMTPQAVFDELGYPDGYVGTDGLYHPVEYAQREQEKDALLTDGKVWFYECWKYRDPADPYRLKVSFDNQGLSATAELIAVPGG